MIAIAQAAARNAATITHDKFLAMLPTIHTLARLAFRFARPEAKEELIAEVVANAFCPYCRLTERGREALAYATPLAWYAIKQVRAGRRVGTTFNSHDVSSGHVRFANGITIERLDHFDADEGEWREALVEDRRAGPADTAAARIDVGAWLRSLARKKRRIAQELAKGEGTGTVARQFKLSAGRVSQLRRELAESWAEFQGELAVA